MAYDPDGDPTEFDPTSLDDIEARLADPVANALIDDLGRAFRALPPDEQIEELTPLMLAAMLRRNEVAGWLAQSDTEPDVSSALRDLFRATQGEVQMYGQRIQELGGAPPDDPGSPAGSES